MFRERRLVWILYFILPFLMSTSSKKDTNNKPVNRFQIRGITASVFRNLSDNGIPFFKVSIVRTFKDGEEFRTTTAFNRDDLPIVCEVSRLAWLDVMKREAEEASSKKRDDE